MPTPLLFALVLAQAAQQGTPPQSPAQTPAAQAPFSFATAPAVAEPNRIELTPKLDGKITDEEWDPFAASADTKTYFQWEPGVVYAAATGPTGKDLVVSLDLKGDGWLVGKDNIEARVTLANGKPVLSIRQLDATNVTGPVWRDLPGFVMASEAAASTDGKNVTYELRLVDPGVGLIPEKVGKKISVRVDLVSQADAPPAPFTPRALVPVDLVATRAAAVPAGLKWNIERNERPVVPGDSILLRLTFNSKSPLDLKKINMRSEGLAKDAANEVTMPFPKFDAKGRAFVDYPTRIDPNADLGYRILRGTITAGDGTPTVIQGSYRIAPILDFDIVHETLKAANHDRSVKMAFYLDCNTNLDLKGEISITVPQGFRILNGGENQKFTILENRERLRRSFDMFIPANSLGTFPIQFKVTYNGKKQEHTGYVTIG